MVAERVNLFATIDTMSNTESVQALYDFYAAGASENLAGEVVSFTQDIDHGGKNVWGDGHNALVADFYDAIENERPFAIDGEQGAGVVRAILAMYRSKGEEVALTK